MLAVQGAGGAGGAQLRADGVRRACPEISRRAAAREEASDDA